MKAIFLFALAFFFFAMKDSRADLIFRKQLTEFRFCERVDSLSAIDDNFSLGSFPYAVTIKNVGCHCKGACSTKANLQLKDDAGNQMTHTTPVCSSEGVDAVYQQVTAGGNLSAGEKLKMDVTNNPNPETDEYTICGSYLAL
ncbi:MAG: hypothetical protein COV74_03490 [Candidatus Omnitrophica bacterium CG11_big_fil_rev_8_21_14_0_20_45_26]|uniref:DUF1573 domain-containing protein n=1 Tax=Candidatus Abzuiibacterium crystallinum TaxID=1974748 RepID=A0A2H0LR05_9BACT|nr:MAG: hypothetical protein COV74_03490 [Candidatus Omnitrophica bacterium CG11_big_fil_rev_8_21_14_0_20_45_26]PIW63328.1 MAG: hypothetical protein COW12_10830 [Candidatus Omnitrophica bacterium CG12_big_fil_rev_8_21_14_0_65_45_16]